MMKMPQANRLHVRNVLQLDSYKIRSSGKSSTATFTPRRLAAKLRAAPDDHARSLRRSAPNRRCRPRDDPLTSVPAEPSRDNKKACARGENDMRFTTHKSLRCAAAAAGIFAAACALPPGPARAQDKPPIVMKISLAALNEALHQFAKDYAALIDKESGGRIKTEIYPASQLGSIPRQIEGTQFGAIQCVVTPPEFYSGIDERFEVMAAPGLVDTLAQAQRLSHDPDVRKLLLGLGADKGLHGVGLFTSQPSSVIAKAAIRHLADFKGKKVRVFASQFQSEAFGRLGLTPVAMTLGDVLPALQQGAIDGAIAGTVIYNAMHYQDAAKYVTNIGQPVIFGLAAVSKKWYDGLPADLQQIIDKAAVEAMDEVDPQTVEIDARADKGWVASGGELIDLPPDEQASMLNTMASVAADVSKTKPALSAAYQIVAAAAQKVKK
jgi:TRAP-type C4-dicarboxylate transport system substrate-binding protein